MPPQAAWNREAVELDEQLVDHAHPAAHAAHAAHDDAVVGAVGDRAVGHGAARPDGVDLVDEDHGAAVLVRHHARFLEQAPDLQVPDAEEHVREPGAGGEQERHSRGAGDGLGHQRLSGSRRPLEQHPVRWVAAHLLEVLEPFEDPHDLLRRLDGCRLPPDVVEGGVVLVRIDDVVVAASEEPEHRDELKDDERHQHHGLHHELTERRQVRAGMQDRFARRDADQQVGDRDVHDQDDRGPLQPTEVSPVRLHAGSLGVEGGVRDSLRPSLREGGSGERPFGSGPT